MSCLYIYPSPLPFFLLDLHEPLPGLPLPKRAYSPPGPSPDFELRPQQFMSFDEVLVATTLSWLHHSCRLFSGFLHPHSHLQSCHDQPSNNHIQILSSGTANQVIHRRRIPRGGHEQPPHRQLTPFRGEVQVRG